jgi:hypothetical protein
MSNWNTKPSLDDARFTFVPPEDASLIGFMPL